LHRGRRLNECVVSVTVFFMVTLVMKWYFPRTWNEQIFICFPQHIKVRTFRQLSITQLWY